MAACLDEDSGRKQVGWHSLGRDQRSLHTPKCEGILSISQTSKDPHPSQETFLNLGENSSSTWQKLGEQGEMKLSRLDSCLRASLLPLVLGIGGA